MVAKFSAQCHVSAVEAVVPAPGGFVPTGAVGPAAKRMLQEGRAESMSFRLLVSGNRELRVPVHS